MTNTAETQRIAKIFLEQVPRIRLSPQVDHERRSALFDLIEDNQFSLTNGAIGPYVLHLSIQEDRLSLKVSHDDDGRVLAKLDTSLHEVRRVIKDYFLVCDSYFNAIKTMTPSRIEAIDMGRRGLHIEGAELLRQRLAPYAAMDLDTARRLFTLICVLHIRS